ncbi:MAG: hypothetical protein U5K69_23455 [Balneolaceae bacterium]|nr:hypothetical protein [Balneolaceae bacterium]
MLTVTEVRRSYAQCKGKRLQVHFVICCEGDRYFHLVYDSDRIIWIPATMNLTTRCCLTRLILMWRLPGTGCRDQKSSS